MHTQKKKRLIKSVLSMAIVAGAAGAATGTYAWYSYQKEVNLDMRGTTIKADKEIQIGLRWNEDLSNFTDEFNHGEIEIQSDVDVNGEDNYIYWIRGNYVSEILKRFQYYIGSAQTTIQPITAGKYAAGDKADGENVGTWTGFKMRPASETPAAVKTEHPTADYHKTMGEVTDKQDYFFLPLAFRVLEAEPDGDGNLVYAENQNIFLSKFSAKDITLQELKDGGSLDDGTEDGARKEAIRQKEIKVDLAKSLRVKTDYPSHEDESDNFIFNPNAIDEEYLDASTGNEKLPVGGFLNIQRDNYYDYDLTTKQEIAYGYFENNIVYKDTPTDETIVDYDDCDTFNAGHLPGGKQIDYTQTTRSICEISKSVVNEKRKVAGEDGADVGAKAIVTTDTNKIGFIDLSIYVEGWDKNITNESAGREFSVELEFSIA